MLYVAFSLVVLNALTLLAFASLLRIERRQSARERDLLVNQLCHVSGRPWQEAPAYREPEREPSEDDFLVTSPEQLP